ncbi:hypothetical protein [Actinoplanes sp. G11-F43]|uniref:hypothetical protein n=1 Tax=Actinoplanes sp. G11-F43 TaxID=3424130 RepID=UPI003D333ED4
MSTAEFDAFGPWIDEVRTVDGLPRLYRDAGIDPAEYRLVLKVPRDIERRNANPGMHLYDYLIALDEKTLTVLSRQDDRYDEVRLPLDRIAAIEDSVRLLNGRLIIHTVDGTAVVVSYNGSANAPVRDLIRMIRRWYLPDAPPPDDAVIPEFEPRLAREDTGLLTDLRHLLAREPGMRPLHLAERRPVIAASTWERLYRRIWPLVLHASIVVTDGAEIQIIHRRDWFTAPGDDLSLARTVLPRSRISRLTVQDHDRYLGIHVITVEAGAACLRFPAPAGPFTEALRRQ